MKSEFETAFERAGADLEVGQECPCAWPRAFCLDTATKSRVLPGRTELWPAHHGRSARSAPTAVVLDQTVSSRSRGKDPGLVWRETLAGVDRVVSWPEHREGEGLWAGRRLGRLVGQLGRLSGREESRIAHRLLN